MQPFGCAELLVRDFILSADTENDRIFLLIEREVMLEISRFFRAPASEILGIEIQNHPLATKATKADRLAVLGVQGEVGCGRAGSRRSCRVAGSASRHQAYQQ